MKKKIAAIALSSVIAMTGLSALSAGASAEWVKNGSSYSYKDDETGEALKGWQEIDGGKYYFNKDGNALTGWYKIGGKKYYFNGAKNGKMVTGKAKIGGKTYDFGTDGILKGEVKAASKSKITISTKPPVAWGTSHDTVMANLGNSEMALDLEMIVMGGDEKHMNLYIFDEDAKLTLYGDVYEGNIVGSFKKAFENKGYKQLQSISEDGTTAYIYSKGDELIVVAYTEEDDTKATMVIFFSPELAKEALKELANPDFSFDSLADYMG